MTPINLTHNTINKIKGMMPSVNREKVAKFFYEYFFDINEKDLASYQQELKAKEMAKEKERHIEV